ncbi:MAG: 4-hydroxybenzoate 3-monooxygenase [Proteobacteria bacterium]|jgi:p-hydroxybenzoate 3-monooxygenase|nr:4-hydroxybenzoate 3-monooxygenase [Pseudomonadota bacterium]MDA1134797.1 4-hydroxybenzoate 3-monooxygenase [Pseudomonadota bacterium]
MNTRVVIIGGGPSGLLLSKLLLSEGIDNIVLEKQSKQHVIGRVRAGVLENGTIEMLRLAGVSERLDKEGFMHDGVFLSFKNHGFRIDLKKLTNKNVTVYGQTEVTKDLYDAIEKSNGIIFNNAKEVIPHEINSKNPFVTFKYNGLEKKISCNFVVGCDGYHGISRKIIPKEVITTYERVYPFGWLGILSETPPVSEELIYANHGNGFALASMRNKNLSRYYIQTNLKDDIENWTDKKFWEELKKRLPSDAADRIITGPSIEKSIAPLRSFVCEPMNWKNLYLVGDAAHIVPPTGAKGLNLAVSDVFYLYNAMKEFYLSGNKGSLNTYSQKALSRVWKATRFSWWMTTTFHKFPEQSSFDQHIQDSELEYLENSIASQTVLAENYVGLPF